LSDKTKMTSFCSISI